MHNSKTVQQSSRSSFFRNQDPEIGSTPDTLPSARYCATSQSQPRRAISLPGNQATRNYQAKDVRTRTLTNQTHTARKGCGTTAQPFLLFSQNSDRCRVETPASQPVPLSPFHFLGRGYQIRHLRNPHNVTSTSPTPSPPPLHPIYGNRFREEKTLN